MSKLKGCSGFDILLETASSCSVRGAATSAANVNGAMVSLTVLQLEGNTYFTAVVGLQGVRGSATLAKGRYISVCEDPAIAELVAMVMSTQADDTKG